MDFNGKRALITGGMGFIGSNLAIALVQHGAEVTIADAMIDGYGGNLFNIEPVRGQVSVNFCDIRDTNVMNYLVTGQDYVFHLAGQVDHVLSLQDPFPDIDMNIKGTAIVMEACRNHAPQARVIYTGTRGQYGPQISLPVNENAPTMPKGLYEISNLTAEKIISVYHDIHGIQSILLRLTNIYGPQVDHVLSLQDPFPDIDMNIKGTAIVMEACRNHAPQARVIYTGTRGQYGPQISLPVNENAPTMPKGLYEISNLTAEKIISVYHDIHGIQSILLRLTNIYGPRAQMQHPRYGVVNWFVRQALDDETIKVFGDGKIKRDFLYVDDCIAAILACATTDAAYGEIFNVGIDVPTDFVELAETLIDVADSGRWEFAPFSPERKAQEPGDFYSDINKIRRVVGWEPATNLRDGLARTVNFYRQYKEHYWS
jgi:UDP-glucose 4-epimerase